MMGQTGNINPDTKQYDNIVYMPCTAENDFFPTLKTSPAPISFTSAVPTTPPVLLPRKSSWKDS